MSFFVPSHLKKYVVPQNYGKYSFEDQAIWRYLMKGIAKNLHSYAYKGALTGLQTSGIYQDQIPKITDIDKNLKLFGWRAICISGFIPPRAFMEFQKYKILPIASELRHLKHIFYTPAPDIVHEAVGHVPFLTHSVFSKFLSQYADTVLKAIHSQQDMQKYKAIRDLSDLKENPQAFAKDIKKQEQKLNHIIKNISHVSEASYLSRLIWWTSEYGLIGSLKNPKMYGAGLISSIGESLQIKQVKKIRLSEKCLQYPFDITKFQPQLFVAESFEHLLEVLDQVSKKLSVYRGGLYAVEQALLSQTLNTVLLDSGLQISGVLEASSTVGKSLNFLKFKGPVQLCYGNKQLKGHGKSYHQHGYSTPLQLLSKNKKPMHLWSRLDLKNQGLIVKKRVSLSFKGGICLKGELASELRVKGKLLVLTFTNCLITKANNELLYDPSWGLFDLGIGSQVNSIFCGPADYKAYQLKDDFEPSKVVPVKILKKQKQRFDLYKKINSIKNISHKKLEELLKQLKKQDENWLLFLELLKKVEWSQDLKQKVLLESGSVKKKQLQGKPVFKLGREFYEV